jgi:hypothetical protein
MLRKQRRITAIQMLNASALETFCMEMTVTVAVLAHILINASLPVFCLKALDLSALAKLAKLTVKTAPSTQLAPQNQTAEIVRSKVTVRILGKETDQPLPSLGFVYLL